MLTKMKIFNYKGQTLIELILVMGIAALVLPAILTGLVVSREAKPQQEKRLAATAYLKEVESAIKNIRNSSWSAFSTNGTFHTEISGTSWSLDSGSSTNADGITQEVVVSDVYRDESGAIVETGGVVDPLTKKVDIIISWTEPRDSSITSTLFIVNTNNETVTQTTEADFLAGTPTTTEVTNNDDGEVALELSFGQADWCSPQDSEVENLTLPKKGNSIRVPGVGSAYVATGDGTEGESFVNVGISYPPPPGAPDAAIVATYSGNYQTNAIYSTGNYAYLAINGTTKQVRILNISSTPYTEVGTITLPSGTNANGVFVDGNNAYVTSSNKIYKVDITNKNGSHSPNRSRSMSLDWFETGTPIAHQVAVVENRVFVTVQGALAGVQIFDKSNLVLRGVGQLTFNQTPRGLFVNSTGTRAYVSFSGGPGWLSKGFFIINTYEPDAFWFVIYFHPKVGTYSTGTVEPRSMAITPDTGNRALIGGLNGTYEYQVVNISNESNPIFCGGLDIPAGVTGVSGALDQYGNVFAFLLTGDIVGGGSDQLKIIQGGAGGGGGGYASSGTFESSSINIGGSAVFNRFAATVTEPVNTSIQMQVGVAAPTSGSCSTAQFTFVGPDGNTGSYYTPVGNTISGSIPIGSISPFYENPEQCFRYKAYYENNTTSSPILEDVIVNYSP